jgi:hypothetical protein
VNICLFASNDRMMKVELKIMLKEEVVPYLKVFVIRVN